MDEDQEKTEAPSQRKREDARREGSVVFSVELNTAMLLLVGLLFVWFGGTVLLFSFEDTFRDAMKACQSDLTFSGAQEVLVSATERGAGMLGLFLLVVFLSAILIGIVQVGGFSIETDVLGFKWDRLDPIAGFRRIFSMQALMRGLFAIVKVTVVGAISYWILNGRGSQFVNFGDMPLTQTAGIVWGIVLKLMLAVVLALLVVGVSDFGYQYYRHERSLMMSKQELKEESKSEEGSPEVKARRRQIAREIASRRKMLEEVPKATVVVTNPTHLAIALRYDRGTMPAPTVIAKGSDAFARRIVELARRHSITVIERKPLAQALFEAVSVGQEIPVALYMAVSEVLAYVYRLKNPNFGQPPV